MKKATHRPWLFVLFAALCVLAAARADAQVPLTWDHYKVYRVNPPAPGGFSVVLRDQFAPTPHQVEFLEYFANPVEKQIFTPPPGQVFPINDPLTHYMWWRISPATLATVVTVSNQFGDHQLQLLQAEYLLNPALKDEIAGPLPDRNHYKCYSCQGQPVGVPVGMVDQWDNWQAIVAIPRWFCTPTDKQIQGGPFYPIVNLDQHYVVYEFTPPDPGVFPAVLRDQFHQGPHDMTPGLYLMVPTEKQIVTGAKSGTWGKLKTLYR